MLPDKIAQLKSGATTALTVAEFWESAIATHGEAKATAFYKSLGLNHLETKGVDWEGLKLSREPNEVEKLCIKSIATAQDAGKASVVSVLMDARKVLIEDALGKTKKLTAATYHKLILTVPEYISDDLREELKQIFIKGRDLVAIELRQQGKSFRQMKQFSDDDLDDLVDLTDSRIANDIQSRITAAATRFSLLGLIGKELWDAVEKEVGEGSTGWLERASQGVANKALNMGRSAEAEDRKDEWEHVEYSAILDSNVCGPCAEDDGQASTSEDDLSPAPNPECEGGDWCRCLHVFIVQ